MSSQFSEESNIRTRHAHTNFPLGVEWRKKIKVWGECYFSWVKYVYAPNIHAFQLCMYPPAASDLILEMEEGTKLHANIFSNTFSRRPIRREGERNKSKVFLPHTPKFPSDQLKTILFSPSWFSSIHSFPTAATNRLKIFSPISTSYKGKHNFQASLWVELPPAEGKRLLVDFNPAPP